MGLEELSALSSVARLQGGCVSLGQAAELGIGLHVVQRAVRAGVLNRIHPSVLHFAGHPTDDYTRIWAGFLAVGPHAVVSHEAALRLHDVDRTPMVVAATVKPDGSHRHRGIRVHRFADLIPEHCCSKQGLPTTTLARAVVDVSSVFSTGRLSDLVDRLTITERRLSIGAIARAHRQVNHRGRVGIARLGGLLDARSGGPMPRSRLEQLADRLLAGSGLAEPRREYPLPTDGSMDGYVDRAWPEARLILEIDGRPWHAREKAMARDRARDRTAGIRGWFTARVLGEEVRDRPDLVLEDLRALYRTRVATIAAEGRRAS